MNWSDDDDCLLAMYYGKNPTADIAAVLGRSENAVGQRAGKLGLPSGRYFSARDIAIIRKRFPHEPTESIAKDLGRTYSGVAQLAHKLRLTKTPEFMRSVGFQSGSQVGSEYRFKKGQVPPNKGARRPGYAPGRMASTQFKKGERSGAAARNYKPVGTIKKGTDGFLMVKVYDNPTYKVGEGIVGDGKSWEYLHRRVWIQHNGAIPPKHHVGFKDGNRENVDISNLELVSFEEMARRNSLWNLPRELAEVIQLAGALKRRIRSAQRGQE